MKIIVVGGTGMIGRAVCRALSKRHEVITASINSGDIQVDIENMESIAAMYETVGNFDALISATGRVHFAKLPQMDAKAYAVGLQSKLMGNVNLVTEGLKWISDNGSFTLTSGILNREPIEQGSSAAMVNGALDAFVQSVAIELPRGLRINAVSPTVIEQSLDVYEPFFRGFEAIDVDRAAKFYVKSVEGLHSGRVYFAE